MCSDCLSTQGNLAGQLSSCAPCRFKIYHAAAAADWRAHLSLRVRSSDVLRSIPVPCLTLDLYREHVKGLLQIMRSHAGHDDDQLSPAALQVC